MPLPALDEEQELGHISSNGSKSTLTESEPSNSRLRKVKSAIQLRIPFWSKKDDEKPQRNSAHAAATEEDASTNYSSGMVDVLDTLDPEVSTLTSLTNMQNSLFIPNLPFLNRRPTYNLRRRKSETESLEEINRILAPTLAARAQEEQAAPSLQRSQTQATATTMMTIDSNLTDSRYAVLPENTDLSGWSVADKKEVNDHVRHMLHSRRSKLKRSLKGFGHYVRRRKYTCRQSSILLLIRDSTGFPRHSLCDSYNLVRTRMGVVLDWLDQRRWTTDLCCSHH